MKSRPKIGSKIPTWFSGEADGLSTVLKVRKYTGRYPQYFRWIVQLSAKETRRGWTEMAM